MTKVGWVYDPLYLEHHTGMHPESERRLQAITALLDAGNVMSRLVRLEAPDATEEDITLIHRPELPRRIRALCEDGGGHLDPDTVVSPRSYAAALRAVGGCMRAVDAVLGGEVNAAYCAVRPPGHHATPRSAMGFCLFNNLAIAARHAQVRHGLQRIAIIDFDVHHGNGTQDAFYEDPSVLYFSTHQHPFYPGTGYWNEVGSGSGEGYTINIPLPAGSGDEEYRACFEEILVPAMRRFQPQMILVSAGYDAHFADPLAGMMLSVAGYYNLAKTIWELGQELCNGRVVFALEGGYRLDALAWAVLSCLDAMMGYDCQPDPVGAAPLRPHSYNVEPLLRTIKQVHHLP